MYKNFQNRPYATSHRKRSSGKIRYQKYLNRKFQKNPPAEHRLLGNIFSGLANLLMLPFRRQRISYSNKKIIVDRWYRVRKLISHADEPSYRSAVIEADKLMDFSLEIYGFHGNKFADRIRDAKRSLPRNLYSGVWQAHILRNDIVHHFDVRVSLGDAKRAVNQFHSALRYLKCL